MSEQKNRVSITGVNSGPMIFGGTSHGDIVGGVVNVGPDTGAELVVLVEQLREEIRTRELPKQEVIDDALEELGEAAKAPGDATPAVPVSRWEKVKKLLAGTADLTGLVVRISEQVGKLWPN